MTLGFRPLGHGDLPRMTQWLAEPHVQRWWNESADPDRVRAKYGPRVDGRSATRMFAIVEDDRPIGWIQTYRWGDYPEHAARVGAEPDEAGIDLAIGDPSRVGQGLGPRIIDAFLVRHVFVDESTTGCVVDPDEANGRSLAAFAKAGFERIGTVHVADAPRGPEDRAVLRRRR